MSMEMGDQVPVVRRGQDVECEVACICWPAHAISGFSAAHPLASKATKVAFCNGVWGVQDGADCAGVCYVHAVERGMRSLDGVRSWEVGKKDVAEKLIKAGLGVLCNPASFKAHVWTKSLFLLPVVIACAYTGQQTREVIGSAEHRKWYDIVRHLAASDIGDEAVSKLEPRVKFLLGRAPARALLHSREEVIYFRDKLVGTK